MSSSAPNSTTTTIIILAILIPLQLACFLPLCVYSRYKKKIIVEPNSFSSQPNQANEQSLKVKEIAEQRVRR